MYDFKSTEFQQQKISFLRRLLCVHFLTLIVNATEVTAQDIKIKHREIHLRILVLWKSTTPTVHTVPNSILLFIRHSEAARIHLSPFHLSSPVFCPVFCYVLSCPVFFPVLSCVLSCPDLTCPVLSSVLSCPVLSSVLSCFLPCPVLSSVWSCPVLCSVLTCPVLSCPVLSCVLCGYISLRWQMASH